ncbi:MAG TPA: isocitrate/isopropylmalate dehydrogenase family protein [bacterium]|nr:isocitrate/isopropylmalate dehydrogenase family protein [bacterium]
MYRVTLVPGDGIGPEITSVTKSVVDTLGVSIEWEEVPAGEEAMKAYGTPMPEQLLASIDRNRVCLKGPITTPVGTGFRSINVALRQHFQLYANLRPVKLFPGAPSRYPEIDLVIVRENTEDLYAGIEFQHGQPETGELIDFVAAKKRGRIRADSGISLKPISITASERIARFAFEYAKKNGRRKVTAVHKANILKYSDGLYLECCRRVSREFPEIEFEDRIVDNMCMQLVQKPELYDVLVLPNLYGDILSDLAAGLVGGLGITAGANIGEGVALFEAVHGSAPKYRGLNKVNPTALIMAARLMLDYLGETKAGQRLENAVAKVIWEGKSVTYDLKPGRTGEAVGTIEMGRAIQAALEK